MRSQGTLRYLCHILKLILSKNKEWFTAFVSCGGMSEIGRILSARSADSDTQDPESILELSTALGLLETALEIRVLPECDLSQSYLPRGIASCLRIRAVSLQCLGLLRRLCILGPSGHHQILAALGMIDPEARPEPSLGDPSSDDDPAEGQGRARGGASPMQRVGEALRDGRSPEGQCAALALLLAAVHEAPSLLTRVTLTARFHSLGIDAALPLRTGWSASDAAAAVEPATRSTAAGEASESSPRPAPPPASVELLRLADAYRAGRECDAALARASSLVEQAQLVLARLGVVPRGHAAATSLLRNLLDTPQDRLVDAALACAAAVSAPAFVDRKLSPGAAAGEEGVNAESHTLSSRSESPPPKTHVRAGFGLDRSPCDLNIPGSKCPRRVHQADEKLRVDQHGGSGDDKTVGVAVDAAMIAVRSTLLTETSLSSPVANDVNAKPPPPPPAPPPPPIFNVSTESDAGRRRKRRPLHWLRIPAGKLEGTVWVSPDFQVARKRARALMLANQAALLELFCDAPLPGAGEAPHGTHGADAGARPRGMGGGTKTGGALIGARRSQLVEIVLLRLQRRAGGPDALRAWLRRALLRLDTALDPDGGSGGLSAEDIEALRGAAPTWEEAEALRRFVADGGDAAALLEGERYMLELGAIPQLARQDARSYLGVTFFPLLNLPVQNRLDYGRIMCLSAPAASCP